MLATHSARHSPHGKGNQLAGIHVIALLCVPLQNTLDRQQVSTDQVINQLRSTIAQQQATINDLVTRLTTLENWSKTAMTCTSTVCQVRSKRRWLWGCLQH